MTIAGTGGNSCNKGGGFIHDYGVAGYNEVDDHDTVTEATV